MTDPTPDPEALDEIASAALDGQASEEERARLDTDPELRRRSDEFAGVRDELAVPPPPAGVLDRAVHAALAEFDDEATDSATGDGDADGALAAPVEAIDAARERRARRAQRWYQRVPVGAVAAGVLVVALVGALSQVDLAGDDDDMATSADATDEAFADDGGAAGGDVEGEMPESAPDEGFDSDDSGDPGDSATNDQAFSERARPAYLDIESLVDDLRMLEQSPDRTTPSTTGAPHESTAGANPPGICVAPEAAGVDADAVVDVVAAVVAGRDVLAVIYDSAEGRRVAVVDEASCVLEDDLAL